MENSNLREQTCGDTFKDMKLPGHIVAALFYLILDNRIGFKGESQKNYVEKERETTYYEYKFNPLAFLSYFIPYVAKESQKKLFQGANVQIKNLCRANRLKEFEWQNHSKIVEDLWKPDIRMIPMMNYEITKILSKGRLSG